MSSLCVLAVPRKREQSFSLHAQRLLPSLISRCVFPRAERLRKRQGVWVIAESPLFPGYVLAEAFDPDALAAALRVDGGRRARFAGTLSPEERALLESIMEPSGLVRLSRGRIENERLLVHVGPLSGLESSVLHVDRHRRTALVAPQGAREDSKSVLVGLEVASKT